MTTPTTDTFLFRTPNTEDGIKIWQLVKDSGKLDLNSPYFYLLMATHFKDTALVVYQEELLAGFVIGYVPPSKPDTYFVWQVGVDEKMRGKGIASQIIDQMLQHLNQSPNLPNIRFLEASVTPSNEASKALFRAYARKKGVPCEELPFFTETHFLPLNHEMENLFHIGPLSS